MQFQSPHDTASASEATMGISVYDFDLGRATEDEYSTIGQLLYDNKVVIIKNQSIDCPDFINLAHRLGTPVPYLQSNYHHPDHPLIFVSSNVKLDDKEIGVPRTGGYWHSDTAFLEQPVPLTLLYPQVIPQNSVRTTLFIDLQKAYDALTADQKEQLEGLTLLHSGRWKYKVRSQDAGLDISEILAMIDNVQPPVEHPAVLTHPVTGRKSIFATRGFTVGVADMGKDDEHELLSWLLDHIERPEFVSTFQWEIGDLIVWDNRFLAHKAGRIETANGTASEKALAEEDTMVYRISVQDNFALSA